MILKTQPRTLNASRTAHLGRSYIPRIHPREADAIHGPYREPYSFAWWACIAAVAVAFAVIQTVWGA